MKPPRLSHNDTVRMAYTGLTAHVRAISGTLVDIQPDWLTYTIVLTVPQSSVRLIRHNLSPAYSL